jgi:hypothetical protein
MVLTPWIWFSSSQNQSSALETFKLSLKKINNSQKPLICSLTSQARHFQMATETLLGIITTKTHQKTWRKLFKSSKQATPNRSDQREPTKENQYATSRSSTSSSFEGGGDCNLSPSSLSWSSAIFDRKIKGWLIYLNSLSSPLFSSSRSPPARVRFFGILSWNLERGVSLCLVQLLRVVSGEFTSFEISRLILVITLHFWINYRN